MSGLGLRILIQVIGFMHHFRRAYAKTNFFIFREILQNAFSKPTPYPVAYEKQIIKLGVSQFSCTKLYYPFNIPTVPYNSSKLFASFYIDNPYEAFTTYFIVKSKQAIIPRTFVYNLEFVVLSSTFELKGLLHKRSLFLLV